MALSKKDEDESDGSSNSDRKTFDSYESLIGEAPNSASTTSGKCPSKIVGGGKQPLQRQANTMNKHGGKESRQSL